MTHIRQKPEKIRIYGEFAAHRDSTWGCRHMLARIATTHCPVLRVSAADLRFYIAYRAHHGTRVTMITVDLTGYPRVGIALQCREKPLYLCPACQAAVLRRARQSQLSRIAHYPGGAHPHPAAVVMSAQR